MEFKLDCTRYWLIFGEKHGAKPEDEKKSLLAAVTPYVEEDDNSGLPDWFFVSGDFYNILVDEERDLVEWVPALGPAPCWQAKLSDFKTPNDIYNAWNKWVVEKY